MLMLLGPKPFRRPYVELIDREADGRRITSLQRGLYQGRRKRSRKVGQLGNDADT